MVGVPAPGSVLVIGSGIAGTAAALAGAATGAHPRLVLGTSGATVLSSGAIDEVPWEQMAPRMRALSEAEERVLAQIDLYALPAAGALVATVAGTLRRARGADRAILDLEPLHGGAVAVPRSDHHGWDASALARAWSDAPLARERSLTFVAVDAQITRFRDEHSLRDAEIAARHDEAARLAWLAERLSEVKNQGAFLGMMLPPWLGIDRPLAGEVSRKLGVPCGEAVVGLSGPSGARFLRARDRALGAAGIETIAGWVKRVEREADHWTVELEDGTVHEAAAVILAGGGLIGGGLRYEPSAAILASAVPPFSRLTFRATIDAPVTIGAHRRPLDLPGSLFGAAPESLAWPFTNDPLLERAGVLIGDDARVTGAPAGLFACGDLVADRPRAWLDALASGVRAGLTASALVTA